MSAAQSLPLEIISAILSLLPTRSLDAYRTKDDFLALLNASHVCRQWYIASLQFSYPWAAQVVLPDVLPQQACEAILLRAGQLPLSISCSSLRREARFQTPAWRFVLEDLRRVKDIRIFFDAQDQDEVLPFRQLLTKAAPHLQLCQLESRWCENAEYQGKMLRLFSGYAPALKCLSLHTSLLPPRVDFSTLSLTHLYLHMGCREADFTPTFAEWLDVLRSQPALAVLNLTAFRYKGIADTVVRDVSFPELRSLLLAGEYQVCGNLFQALAIPGATCDVQFDVHRTLDHFSNGMEQGIGQFLADLDRHNGDSSRFWWSLACGAQGGLFRLQLCQSRSTVECCCLSSTGRRCEVHREGPDPNVKLLIHLANNREEPLVNTLKVLLKTFSNSPLRKRRATFDLLPDPTTDPDLLEEIKHNLITFKDISYRVNQITSEAFEDRLDIIDPGCDLCDRL
ncbi:hypothetical protein CVT26_005984 [Gymnopilus dilepis]|uniref:F-box domain-containing protein n=1 Tax=Gymnopilus dilepis TaxID=231916 RepID=A0A409Y1T4_9AGAR|nr:hypothetical protein CVT26_005984 [Gymnopilus dilepis]